MRYALIVVALALLVGCMDTTTGMKQPESATRFTRQQQSLGNKEYIVVIRDTERGIEWTIWKACGTESLTSQLLAVRNTP